MTGIMELCYYVHV